MTYTNKYYSNGRTYEPLYVYYRAPNYFHAGGYYSSTFLLIYYDGYGYNFYYGGYGYYEYSVNPRPGPSTGFVVGIIICSVCCCILIGFGVAGGSSQEEEEVVVVSQRRVVIHHV